MFTRTNARKKLLPYMADTWDELEEVFYKNLERAATGRPEQWKKTPSVDAVKSWNNILKRNGIRG